MADTGLAALWGLCLHTHRPPPCPRSHSARVKLVIQDALLPKCSKPPASAAEPPLGSAFHPKSLSTVTPLWPELDPPRSHRGAALAPVGAAGCPVLLTAEHGPCSSPQGGKHPNALARGNMCLVCQGQVIPVSFLHAPKTSFGFLPLSSSHEGCLPPWELLQTAWGLQQEGAAQGVVLGSTKEPPPVCQVFPPTLP